MTGAEDARYLQQAERNGSAMESCPVSTVLVAPINEAGRPATYSAHKVTRYTGAKHSFHAARANIPQFFPYWL
jgi:hypothetical protein